MNRVPTKVIKARQVEVSYVIDERDEADIQNLDRLRKQGVRDFGGQIVDVKLTDYLTVHNVIAIEDINFESAKHAQQHYMIGSSPRKSTVTVKFIIDNARMVQLHEENLIVNDDVIDLPQSSVKAIT